jgi:hypothetical protein
MPDPHDLAAAVTSRSTWTRSSRPGSALSASGVNVDERLPEDRGPENPYDPGAPPDVNGTA